MTAPSDLVVRRATAEDRSAVVDLLRSSLGWDESGEHERFFSWKHDQSPFGASPAWVATAEERIVGFRTFSRWEFDADGDVVRAARAVDTATHPDFQGRGIFSRLTLHALAELAAERVAFVFNTPNDRSRPGYLKMGWQVMGRQPLLVRPRLTPTALRRTAAARAPAEKWSLPATVGLAPADAFADDAAVAALLERRASSGALRTRLSPAFLRWRYGFGPLQYRVLPAGSSIADGCVVFRTRRRGAATELTVCDVIVPGREAGRAGRLLRRAFAAAAADFATATPAAGTARAGFVPFPGRGPIVTWRDVCEDRPRPFPQWRLTLGDVELF